MTNKTNLALLNEFTNRHAVYYKSALRLAKTEHVADDLMQQVAYRLLMYSVDFQVDSLPKFLYVMLKQASYNDYRVNKKYVMLSDFVSDESDDSKLEDLLLQNHIGCDYQESLEERLTVEKQRKLVLKEAKNLPPKQQQAIMNAMNGFELTEVEFPNDEFVTKRPEYNTLKAHKRIATEKLRNELRKEKV